MAFELDSNALNAVFRLPSPDGAFDEALAAYLGQLGQRRKSVIFAFPPKAAGTFLRSAAIEAVDGQLMRIVHAYGGRDGTPYLPVFVLYLAGGFPDSTLVSHIHMQALPANCHLIDTLDLKPVIMLRSVPDMLLSYLDMLENEPITPDRWLNGYIPPKFADLDDEAKGDFIVDMLGPWYASYYATWFDYAAQAPGRVCAIRYADFKRDPAEALGEALRHSGLERTREECERAIAATWPDRDSLRFNIGETGRGATRFNARQREKLETMLFRHYDLVPYRHELMPQAA
jgi:hypothetical protein